MVFSNSTDVVRVTQFRHHGSVDLQIEGNVVRYDCCGPFNEQLITAFEHVHASAASSLLFLPQFASLCVFHQSAMLTPEALERFSEHVRTIDAKGVRPVAMALVFAPDVEGCFLMRPLYARCFAAVGWEYQDFADEAEARAWLQERLQEAGA